MKFIIPIILFLFLFNPCQSQVTIAKQFDENEYICSGSNFEGVNLYATFNSTNNLIKIYNENHKVVKSLTYNSTEYYNRIYIYGLSFDVFNSNSQLEFLIQSFNGKGETIVQLIDDQNRVIQEFKTAGIRTIGNKNYIVESISEMKINVGQLAKSYQTDILYSINGKFRRIVY